MSEYKITIGLEVHAELKTKTKMFCGCINSSSTNDEFSEKNPNAFVCPVCMGYPGTLPVINKEAVKKVLLVGTAVGANIADFTEFDRKNYFYPDIPKGYQISQYKYPLVSGGEIAGVKLTRIHLEEDTARSSHDVGDYSLVDFNRAGVPLMELVTEPVIHSATEAMNFARELQLLLQYLNVSDANMEKGEMRVEVNFSISKDDNLGTKVEIKNINSFKSAGKAIEYEYKRQKDLLEKGEKIIQETRGFDESKGITFSQRSKEEAHDYRYFPDPDLPKLVISEIPEFKKEVLEKELLETPEKKRERFKENYSIKAEDTEFYINNRFFSDFFEDVALKIRGGGGSDIYQTASNYITTDLVGLYKLKTNKEALTGKITSDSFVRLISLLKEGSISSRGAKDILKIMFEEGGDAEQIANAKGLIQKNDTEELRKIIEKIIIDNQKVVDDYKNGKESAVQFFVGQAMKITKGSANPSVLKEILTELLSK